MVQVHARKPVQRPKGGAPARKTVPGPHPADPRLRHIQPAGSERKAGVRRARELGLDRNRFRLWKGRAPEE